MVVLRVKDLMFLRALLVPPAPSGLGQGLSSCCCKLAPTRLLRYLNLINTNQSVHSNYCTC